MATKKAASVGGSDSSVRPQPGARTAVRRKPAAKRKRATASRKARSGRRTPMKPGCRLEASEPLESHLRSRVIGQDIAIDALVSSWARVLSGLRDPDRPMLTALLLGPTGVGKTETAKALAEALFGSVGALIRIDCEEYAHGHEVAKLLGSPPGYVGSDIEPLLSQHRIDRAHWQSRQERKAHGSSAEPLIERVHDAEDGLHSVLLFDEVEKAHPTLWNALLGILEEGEVTLGNNKTSDLTRSIILMTSNVGSREMHDAFERPAVGFVEPAASADVSLGELARSAARNVFPAEFINRFDQVLVYEPLSAGHLDRIFDKFLDEVTRRAMDQAGVPLLIKVSRRARAQIVDAGTDRAMGARPLRRSIERMIVDPLSRLLASQQLVRGDVVEIDLGDDGLAFYRLPRSPKRVVA